MTVVYRGPRPPLPTATQKGHPTDLAVPSTRSRTVMIKKCARAAPAELTDAELVKQTLAGDRDYYAELVNRYTARVFHFLRARVARVEDAEDLVQETFVKAYLNLARYQPKHQFSTWLFTIAARLMVSHYRKIKTMDVQPISRPALQDPLQILVREEERENIWMLARRLHQDQYDALWLRYVEDMNIGQISKVLKKTRIHIRVLLHRGRRNLSKHMASEERTHESEPVPRLETVTSCGPG